MVQQITGSADQEIISLLQTQLAERELRRPGYSLRNYARALGLNPTQLAETLRGKRPLTRKIAARVFERLGIDPEIGRGLIERLPAKQVRKKRAKAKLEKELGLSRASSTGPTTEDRARGAVLQYVQLSTDEFRVIADWYHFAILSLAETRGFKSDTKWISERLGIRERDAKSAVDCLQRLGLMVRKPSGRLVVTGKRFTTTNDIPDASIRKNHAQGLEQARDALDFVPIELREITATIIAADPKLLPKAKERLRELKREISSLLESGEKREVYRLSIQLIPLSKEKKQS